MQTWFGYGVIAFGALGLLNYALRPAARKMPWYKVFGAVLFFIVTGIFMITDNGPPPKASNSHASGDRACEESREAFVRQFARSGVSREQAEAAWYETHQTMKFADIDCAELARRKIMQ